MSGDQERQPLLLQTDTTPTAPPPQSGEEPPPYVEEVPLQPQTYSGVNPAPYPPPPSNVAQYPPPSNVAQYPPPPTNTTPYPPPITSNVPAPPPYSPSPAGQNLFVQCRVCQHVINVPQGSQSRVVKCGSCHEATPIASPPPGKKYVRCPCNCLLTCSVTATRVICPRDNCKRTIGVGSIAVRQTVSVDRVRVNCGHCHRSILWPANASVARCPHCRGRSYLHMTWMRNRALFCFIMGAIFLLVGTLVTGVTVGVAASIGGIYVISVGFFVSGIAFIIRGIFYCAMTHSTTER